MSISIDVAEDRFSEMDGFRFNADFNGRLDREATVEVVDATTGGTDNTGYARGDLADDDGGIGEIPDSSGGTDDLGEALAAEANRAWARSVGLIEGGADEGAKSQSGTGYGLTNPHEFVATATEAVRTGQRSKVATRSQTQPEFMAILMAILEPSGELDDLIEQLDINL
jgi:hypothetical protein